MKISLCFILTLLFFTGMSSAQTGEAEDLNFPPPENPPVIKVERAAQPLTIDGSLEEADWGLATPVSDFFRREPRQGGPIRYETEVRFLYDEKYLYVGAFCKDSVGFKGIRVQDLQTGFQLGRK